MPRIHHDSLDHHAIIVNTVEMNTPSLPFWVRVLVSRSLPAANRPVPSHGTWVSCGDCLSP